MRYHAAAAIAANHLVALLGQVERVASSIGAPLDGVPRPRARQPRRRRRPRPRRSAHGPRAPGRHGHRRGATSPRSPRRSGRRTRRSPGRQPDCAPDHRGDDRRAARAARPRARAGGRTVGLRADDGVPARRARLPAAGRSRRDGHRRCLSIFVNPLQFGPTEDLDAYPRDLAGDVAVAEAAGADLVFAPSTGEMYPEPVLTTVSVGQVSAPLEGRARPTHFDGVATVVAKLFGDRGSLPRVLRREGLPAARRRPPHGGRPVAAGRGRRLPDGARARRPGHVEPQRLPRRGGAGRRAGAAPRAARRAGRRSRRGSGIPPRSGSRWRPRSTRNPWPSSTTPRSSTPPPSPSPTPSSGQPPPACGRQVRRG